MMAGTATSQRTAAVPAKAPGAARRSLFVGAILCKHVYSPLSSEYGTYKTVTTRFWPWLPGQSAENVLGVPSSLVSGWREHVQQIQGDHREANRLLYHSV